MPRRPQDVDPEEAGHLSSSFSWERDKAWDPDEEYGTDDSDGKAPWERKRKDEAGWA